MKRIMKRIIVAIVMFIISIIDSVKVSIEINKQTKMLFQVVTQGKTSVNKLSNNINDAFHKLD